MATKRKKKVDGRTTRYGKNTTEKHNLTIDEKTLTIFRYTDKSATASPYWQARFTDKGKIIQRTTKEENLKKAKIVGRKWMTNILDRRVEGMPLVANPQGFTSVAELVLRGMESVSGKSRHSHYHKNYRYLYEAYIQSFFNTISISDVNTPKLNEWVDKRLKDGMKQIDKEGRELPTSRDSLKREMIFIRMVLQRAVEEGHIGSIPEMPKSRVRAMTPKTSAPPRTYFNSADYRKLIKASREWVNEAKKKVEKKARGPWANVYTQRRYCHYFIIFAAGTGARTYELLRMKHKQIKCIDTYTDGENKGQEMPDEDKYLFISIEGKTGRRSALGRWSAYFAYQKLKDRLYPDAKKDDFVFPYNPSQSFRQLLEYAGLRWNEYDEKRDVKSLRHYFISNQLAQGLDIWELSRQVGADPTIIHKHYARHIKTEQYKDVILKRAHIELL